MRSFLAGFLSLALASSAFAQARGQVESIGFGGAYRPGCWTPMVVHLVSTTSSAFNGRIEVIQEDLDRDQVIFTRQITLTGNTPNSPPVDQRFSMYFIPQPTRDPKFILDGTRRTDELTELIKVRLCTDTGKELVKLPITQALQPIEPLTGGSGTMVGGARGRKVILGAYDRNVPNLGEYAGMWGITEDVQLIPTRNLSTDLPDDVRGYDAIDAIIWTDANPNDLKDDSQVAALEEFVRRGGKIIFAQDTNTNQWQRNNVRFPLLMPVNVRGVEERDDRLGTLRNLAIVPLENDPNRPFRLDNPWYRLKGPFRYATCEVKPGAQVVLWQTNDKGETIFDDARKPRPYVVRQGFGAGSVTWVAQDLGDKQVLGERDSTNGWASIWDRLFDWPNEPMNPKGQNTQDDWRYRRFDPNSSAVWELGRSFLGMMDLPSTSAALIGIAVLFFIVYWVAAGPGSYFVLLKKGRATMSWFAFAAIAIGAIGLTIAIVKVALRGAPQLQHVTFIRFAPGEPARAHSQFGLYIPRDGYQKIELKETVPNRTSYITAFNQHPAFLPDSSDFPAHQDYYIPVKEMAERDREPADPRVIQVPYRSTLKKFQAEWVGNLPAAIDGSVTIVEPEKGGTSRLAGTLSNHTGRDLRRVYLVVNHPFVVPKDDGYEALDLVLYVSLWKNGTSINLGDLTGPRGDPKSAPYLPTDASDNKLEDSSGNVVVLRGHIAQDRKNMPNWTEFWYKAWRASGFVDSKEVAEKDPLKPTILPLLSFYDRLPPSQNARQEQSSRFDYFRKGVRHLDMSAAISAGNMAVIAVADNREEPLPFPLRVQGDPIQGKGIVYFQFVLPVDRTAAVKLEPTTKPSTQPAKGKAEG
jgi:hypothetical protein